MYTIYAILVIFNMTKWKDKYTQEQIDKYNKRRREKYAALSEEEKSKHRSDCNERAKKRYIERKDEIDTYHKEYREKNKHLISKKDRARRQKLRKENPTLNLFRETKKRAKINNIDFNITEEDIIIPTHCPILGIKLAFAKDKAKENSPSLDRIIPEKGYVKGNCCIISKKANRMKQDNTPETLRAILAYIEERITHDEQ